MKEIYDEHLGKTIIIPTGEEGVTETFEESINNIERISQELLETEYYEQAKILNKLDIPHSEATLISKYLEVYPNMHLLSDEEVEQVVEVISSYVPSIRKHKPQEMLHNYEENTQTINAYEQFMQLTDKSNQITTIPFSYTMGKQTIDTEFDVYPITDNQAVLDISTELELFKDFTEKEMLIYNKNQQGNNLSREEQIILNSVNKRIQEKTIQQSIPIITEFLSIQLQFKGCNVSRDEMRTALRRIPIKDLLRLYEEVEKILGLDNVTEVEVFQTTNY